MVDLATTEPGTSLTYERTSTREEIEAPSRDEGYHHLIADADGTVLVHGQLTSTLPTNLGGDIDFLARSMRL